MTPSILRITLLPLPLSPPLPLLNRLQLLEQVREAVEVAVGIVGIAVVVIVGAGSATTTTAGAGLRRDRHELLRHLTAGGTFARRRVSLRAAGGRELSDALAELAHLGDTNTLEVAQEVEHRRPLLAARRVLAQHVLDLAVHLVRVDVGERQQHVPRRGRQVRVGHDDGGDERGELLLELDEVGLVDRGDALLHDIRGYVLPDD